MSFQQRIRAIAVLCFAAVVPLAAQAAVTATLVRVIDTSLFVPPSPDAAGIAYASHSGRLLMSDSEVNEMAIYEGANLFEMNLIGNLLGTSTTVSYSGEPTGVAYNPVNQHVFFTDDDQGELFEVDPGPDMALNTLDDVVTSFDTNAFGSGDPEGVTFDTAQGFLYVVDGNNSRVYEIDPGVDGSFNGVPPAGDDDVSSFPTDTLGVDDPEGIGFRDDTGDLLIVGFPADLVIQVSTSGTLVESYDISAASAVKPAGLTYAPSSIDSTVSLIYVTERGIDNNSDPDENDGMIYELSLAPIVPSNLPPLVDAGADHTVVIPDVAVLYGAVSDGDGPGPLTSEWRLVDGPAPVTFADPDSALTTATFTTIGTHVLRIIADDGELLASDDVVIEVTDSGDPPSVSITTPADMSQFVTGQQIDFAGTANSTSQGDISASIDWLSSIDGIIGSGAAFAIGTMSIGDHTVTAAATDDADLTGTAQITITVTTNNPPIITITSPSNGTETVVGESVNFSATAQDGEDGDIAAALDWTSDIDGRIGNGASFDTAALSAGTHTITAAATDTGNLTGVDQVTVFVDSDADGDGSGDTQDNCTFHPNGPSAPDDGGNVQRDTDGDGFGNACDADLNNDCIVNPTDLGLFASVYFTADPHADFNGDGSVNPVDLGRLRTLFFAPPGPSAAATCP